MANESGHQRPLLVALTGGIASGKTAVSERLENLGAVIVDTDLIAREVVEPGEQALAELVDAFGAEILDVDGALDRKALGERVFANPEQRRHLEAILHPRIEQRARQRIDEHQNAPYIVVVVPLLVESAVFSDADRVVVVDVPENIQIDRLLKRTGIGEQQARQMLAAQATRNERLDRADHVIENSGSLAELDVQVRQLHADLLEIRKAQD